MPTKTPAVIITGYLGSGKTTLLRGLIEKSRQKLAILMNEFGELSVDSQVIAGKNIVITELSGGCVCCSLVGEFEAAIQEIIETIHPDEIVVETTGLAEPDALIADIRDNIPDLLVDAVVTVVDADATLRFPSIGHTGRVQIEMADLILLNKMDLVPENRVGKVRGLIRSFNPKALLLETVHCRVDPSIIFGRPSPSAVKPKPEKVSPHPIPLESTEIPLSYTLRRDCFEKIVQRLSPGIYRAKGFVRFEEGIYLFNFVAGRWDLEPWSDPVIKTGVVLIGEKARSLMQRIASELEECSVR